MLMKIIEYNETYIEELKDLLEELQEYIVSIDPYHFNILKDDYKEKIYLKDMEEVKNNEGKIYLAIYEDKIIGLIIGVIRKAENSFDYERLHNMGEVIELIVTKNSRKKRVGYELLNKMEEYFKEKKCYTINIDVFGYNEIGKNFYFKNGYHNRMMTVSKKLKND